LQLTGWGFAMVGLYSTNAQLNTDAQYTHKCSIKHFRPTIAKPLLAAARFVG